MAKRGGSKDVALHTHTPVLCVFGFQKTLERESRSFFFNTHMMQTHII